MVDRTTGQTSFNLDLNNLVEDAFERCGQELRTGYDLRTARRSLNLMTIEWANRGINLWTVEPGQITLNQNQIMYALPTDTIDLLDMVTRTGTGSNQQDININRISESTYITIPNKNATGRPIQVWINRQSGQENPTTLLTAEALDATETTITLTSTVGLAQFGFIKVDNETIQYGGISGNDLVDCVRGVNYTTAATHITATKIYVQNLPTVNVWPAPDQSSFYTFVYYRLRRIQDAGTGLSVEDIPFRFIPCMVAGLAAYLSMKLPNVDPTRIQMLRADYEAAFQLAADEDREKASIRFVPRDMSYIRQTMAKSAEEYLKDLSQEQEDLLKRFDVSGGGSKADGVTAAGGRLAYKHPIDASSDIEVGASGHYVKGKGFKDKGIDRLDAIYRKKFENESELRAKAGVGKRGQGEFNVEYEIPFKKGGKVKASKVRGHGIEKKGKTKGRFV